MKDTQPPPPEPPPLDAAQTIAPAMRYMWLMLTRPFSLRKWLLLALVSLLAGLFGGGGFNFGSGGDWRESPRHGHVAPYLAAAGHWAREHIVLLVTIAGAVLLLGLLVAYLSAVFRFVFLDSVARNRVEVKRAFGENWDRGLALFLWQAGFALLALLLLGLGFFLIVFPFIHTLLAVHRGGPAPPAAGVLAALAVVLGILLTLLGALVVALIQVTLMDFVLPVMYLEGLGIWASWRRALGLIRAQLGAFALYYVLKIPVGIAAAMASGLLGVLGLLAAVIPLGILALAGFLVFLAAKGGHLAWAWTPGTIFLTVFGGGIAFVYVVYGAACAALPVAVFRQAWALCFLGQRDRSLAVIGPPPPTLSP